MASRTLVKNYVAQWMQMGKTVSLSTQGEQVRIYKILQGKNTHLHLTNFGMKLAPLKPKKPI